MVFFTPHAKLLISRYLRSDSGVDRFPVGTLHVNIACRTFVQEVSVDFVFPEEFKEKIRLDLNAAVVQKLVGISF